MSSPSTTGYQLYADADALNASSERPRRQVSASKSPQQPAVSTTWSNIVSMRASPVRLSKGLPDSSMAPRKRFVVVWP